MKAANAARLACIFAATSTEKRTAAPKIETEDPRAARAAELKRQVTSLETELSQLEAELKTEAAQRWREAEEQGDTLKTVDYGPCRVTRQDRSKTITEEQAEQLKGVIGAQLAKALLVPDTSAKVKPAKLAGLLERLGDDASQFLEVASAYKACSKWIETRGALRPILTEEKNELLDAISVQLLVSPSITYKG